MPRTPPAPRKRKAHFYWWTLANTLAACMVVLSWVLCLHLFGHPEIPRNYEILNKLGRIDPPVGFDLQQAPPGEAADPRALYRRYAALPADALGRLNAALMRNYLRNLRESGLIQYIEGTFRVLETRPLDEDDLFHPGFAVRAQALVQPDEFSESAPWPVRIDYLFPTSDTAARQWFVPGDIFPVSKVPNCAMVLHVARSEDGDTPLVNLVVVPVAIGGHRAGEDRTLEIAAPEKLNPAAVFPVFDERPEPAP